MNVTVAQQGNQLVINFDFDRELVETVKHIPGARWNKTQRHWTVPSAVLPFVLTQFPGADYKGQAATDAKRHMSFWHKHHIELELNGDIDPPTRELYPFQRKGVVQMRELERGLVADDMGLGKTLQSLMLAQHRQPKRVLCLVKASLKLNWAAEIQKTFPEDTVGIGYGSFAKWVIESYDTAWRKKAKDTLLSRTFDVAILDEIQALKNVTTKRFDGAHDILEKIPVRYGLTGTPMQNRPLDLIGGLISLGYLTKGSRWGFMRRYCDPQEGWYGVDYSGHSNLDELHKALKFFMVRRLKEDVLTELPPKIYTDDVVELDKKSGYWQAEKDYRDYLRMVKSGKAQASKLSREGALLELGQKAAVEKIDFAEDRVKAALDAGMKVLLFSTYKRPIEELRRRFGGSCIGFTGDTAPDDRAKAIQAFEENDFIRAAFLTTGAGGEGFNMTAANVVMFLNQPWNPSQKEQAEDRAHRIGQTRGLQVVNLIAKNTVDEPMVAMLAKKHKVIARTIDGTKSEFESSEGLLEEMERYYS